MSLVPRISQHHPGSMDSGLPGLCSLRVHRDLGTGYKLGLINADKGLVSVMLP